MECAQKKRGAFTIVEVIIVLSIAVFMLGSLFALLSQAWAVYRRGSFQAHANKDIQRAFRFMKDKFSRANKSLSVYKWMEPGSNRPFLIFNPPDKSVVSFNDKQIAYDHWKINVSKARFKSSAEVDTGKYKEDLRSKVALKFEKGSIIYTETPPIDKEKNKGAAFKKTVLNNVDEFKVEQAFGDTSRSLRITITVKNPQKMDRGQKVSSNFIMTFVPMLQKK
ncbi:type II secretion system protein J [Candidatus Riflebacteria bacterium]